MNGFLSERDRRDKIIMCKNCGHESHCGGPLRKVIDKSKQNEGGLSQIEVCKHCRCDQCSPPDWG